jgi:hypothetical protein
MKFVQADRNLPQMQDAIVKVQVRLYPIESVKGRQRHVKGNIARSFTIKDARISDVLKAIKDALL